MTETGRRLIHRNGRAMQITRTEQADDAVSEIVLLDENEHRNDADDRRFRYGCQNRQQDRRRESRRIRTLLRRRSRRLHVGRLRGWGFFEIWNWQNVSR